MRVRRSYTGGTLSTPKNRERRDVDLISDVVELLAGWRREGGSTSHRDSLVFPGDDGLAFMTPSVLLRRQLYPAMARASIPRVGPTQEKRTFHSLRHTCEAGAGARRSDHLALTSPRPLIAQGDNRHLRTLGARRAKAPSGQDGGCVSGLRTCGPMRRDRLTAMLRTRLFAGTSLMGRAGIEPATLGLKVPCSTN